MSTCTTCAKAQLIFKCLENVTLTNLEASTDYRVRLQSLTSGYNIIIPITSSLSGDIVLEDVEMPVKQTIRFELYDDEGCQIPFPLYNCSLESWVGEYTCAEFRILNAHTIFENQRLSI